MPIHDPLDDAPAPSVPLTATEEAALMTAVREAHAAASKPPVYDLRRAVLEPALTKERKALADAKETAAWAWSNLDRALDDEQRATDAIAQIEAALAALDADGRVRP